MPTLVSWQAQTKAIEQLSYPDLANFFNKWAIDTSHEIILGLTIKVHSNFPYHMYVIEILLKNTAMPMSVQRKTVEEATTVYEQVLAAMKSSDRNLLELACDRQPEKKIAVMTDSIVAAQMYEKSGAAASGKTPGFVAFAAS